MFVTWLESSLNPIKIMEYFHVLISNQFLGLHIFFYSVFMISNKGCIEKFSWTYLKNSLECTALEVRKYQTGFLGLLVMVWRVVFPLASWKISKCHFTPWVFFDLNNNYITTILLKKKQFFLWQTEKYRNTTFFSNKIHGVKNFFNPS